MSASLDDQNYFLALIQIIQTIDQRDWTNLHRYDMYLILQLSMVALPRHQTN